VAFRGGGGTCSKYRIYFCVNVGLALEVLSQCVVSLSDIVGMIRERTQKRETFIFVG
jgi:hypothetical protein